MPKSLTRSKSQKVGKRKRVCQKLYQTIDFQVLNAVSVIDFGPPPQRKHVTVKLKKLQKEKERQMKIQEDNFKLLQHLGSIMNSKRVDNYWQTQLPNFLGRVGVYPRTRTPTPFEEITPKIPITVSSGRKSKCLACTPQPEESIIIPEERIPWAPPKKILTKRQSRSAVVPVTSDFDIPKPNRKVKTDVRESKKKEVVSKDDRKLVEKRLDKSLTLPSLKVANIEEQEQRIVVKQGPIQIVVNIPSFADVKMVRGDSEKYLQTNYCECKLFKRNKTKPTPESKK